MEEHEGRKKGKREGPPAGGEKKKNNPLYSGVIRLGHSEEKQLDNGLYERRDAKKVM